MSRLCRLFHLLLPIISILLRTRTWAGSRYLLNRVVPNVFFHCTTTYNILRHNGVEIGKADFLGPLDD